jgi:hypothetical protein
VEQVAWKSEAAKQAYAEMIKIAGIERDRLINDLLDNTKHSEYEKGLLRIKIVQAFLNMVGRAYETAMIVEAHAQSLHASIMAICSE